MNEADWFACTEPGPMLEFLKGRVDARSFRLFMVACCRRRSHLLLDCRSHRAVNVAEMHALGKTTRKELAVAERAARTATRETRAAEGATGNYFLAVAASVSATLFPPERAAAEAAWFAVSGMGSWGARQEEQLAQVSILKEVFGNPFCPVVVDPAWLRWNNATVPKLAKAICDGWSFQDLPILADALEDAGCQNEAILDHCRQSSDHACGCWVLALFLGKPGRKERCSFTGPA